MECRGSLYVSGRWLLMTAKNPSWRELANILAGRLKHAAAAAGSVPEYEVVERSGCRHAESEADPDNCPFCADRAAFQLWERKVKRG